MMQQVNQNRALRQVDNFLHKNIKSQKPAVQNVNLKSQLLSNNTKKVFDENQLVQKFQSKIPVFKSRFGGKTEKPVAKPIENIDRDQNCLLLSDYAIDIYKYLREVETNIALKPDFLAGSPYTPSMRAILIDWVVSVTWQFRLAPETLYLAIWVLDRFFEKHQVPKKRLQLAGATAIFIAGKFEEVYYPSLADFVAVCDDLYKGFEFLKMEQQILKVIDFQLDRPLAPHFLRRGSKASHADGRTHMMGKYLCELAQIDYECAQWKPSLLAATALYVSLRLHKSDGEVWSATTEHYTNYSQAQVEKHAVHLCQLLLNAPNSKQQATRKKYQDSRFMSISQLSEKSLNTIQEIIEKNGANFSTRKAL